MNCPECRTANPQHNRFCRACGHGLGGRVSMSVESERRQVTVMFADMTGFTAMSERMDPEHVQRIMNRFFQELAERVHRYGGIVDKYTGDGIMALFGAPRAHEDDPERALAAALEMPEGMKTVNQQLAAELPHPISLHIGINTGLVVTGRVGESNRSDYTAIGDTVNLAARLEDLSEDGQIIVSESTHNATKHAFVFDELEPVRVKGKSKPVPIWLLKGRARTRRGRRGVPGVKAPLIGRDAELQMLNEAVARLVQGCGGYVAVVAPAGLGKTRLLEEAREAAAARPVRWVKAACTSLGLAGTLSVWADAMRGLLDPTGSYRRRATTKLTSTTSMMSVDEARDASAVLATLLHLDLTEEERQRMGGMDEEAMRRRLFIGVRDVIEREAMAGPLVLLLDDLHWCDSASMQLLALVLESTARVPLLVITSFRSDADTIRLPLEEALAKAMPPFRLDIELKPLSMQDSEALAAALVAGSHPKLAEVRAELVNYAEGNPLFMEEVIRSLLDQKVLIAEKESGSWSVAEGAGGVVVPDTLQGLLLDRIDRLPEQSKRLAQMASVIGRSFPVTLLTVIAGGGDTAQGLATLVQAGIIERTGNETDDPVYSFRHALMQEAAYSSLTMRRREEYHGKVAEWYERLQGDSHAPPELTKILAYHWERAARWAFACRWAVRAADEYRRNFVLDEAAEFYLRAITHSGRAGDADTCRAAEQGLGETYLAEGVVDKALEHFVAALEQAREPLDRAVIERRVGQTHDRDGNTALALAAFGRAAAMLGTGRQVEPAEWTAERARLGIARAFAHLNRGEDELARAAAESALHADLPAPDRSDITRLLGETASRAGDMDRAERHFLEALRLARDAMDLAREAAALDQLSSANLRRGRRDAARVYLGECLEVRRRLGDDAGCGRVLLELAALDEHAGALRQAADRLRQAVEYAMACDEPVVTATARLRLGRVLRTIGDWQEARAVLERAGTDDPEVAGRAALELALLALRRGELPEGPLRQALDQGQQFGVADLAAHARLGLSFLARRRGRRDEARAYLRDVLTTANGRVDEATIAARVALSELALDDGRAEMAATSARRALEEAERSGPVTLVWSARRSLGAALSAMGDRVQAEAELRIATDAARAANAYPELARCLADWIQARGGPPRSPSMDTESQRLFVEMREVLAYLTRGGAPPPPPTPAPAGAGARVSDAG